MADKRSVLVVGLLSVGILASVSCSNRRVVEDASRPLRLEQLTYESPETKTQVVSLWASMQREPDDAGHRFELAAVLLRNQYPAPAIALLRNRVCRESGSPRYFLLLATALQMHSPSHLPRVLALLEEGESRFPNDPQIHASLGHAYIAGAQHQSALREFDQALHLEAGSNVILSAGLGRAAALRKLGRDEEAEQQILEVRNLFPTLDAILHDAQVSAQIPAPLYLGTIEDDGVHPEPKERVRRVQEEIDRLSKERQ